MPAKKAASKTKKSKVSYKPTKLTAKGLLVVMVVALAASTGAVLIQRELKERDIISKANAATSYYSNWTGVQLRMCKQYTSYGGWYVTAYFDRSRSVATTAGVVSGAYPNGNTIQPGFKYSGGWYNNVIATAQTFVPANQYVVAQAYSTTFGWTRVAFTHVNSVANC